MSKLFPPLLIGLKGYFYFYLLLAAGVFLYFELHLYFLFTGQGDFSRDFYALWSAASAFAQGDYGAVYLPEVEKLGAWLATGSREAPDYILRPFPYPPYFLLYLYPLGLLPLDWAFALWSVAGIALYLYALLRPCMRAYYSKISGNAVLWKWILPVLVLFPSTLITFIAGQTGLFTAALLMLGFSELQRRPALAGIFLGILAFKPQLCLLIPFALFAGGHLRTLVAMAVTALLMILYSWLAMAPDIWRDYAVMADIFRHYAEAAPSWIANLSPTPFFSARMQVLPISTAYAVQAIISLWCITRILIAFRSFNDSGLQLALLAVGIFIASPYALIYEMPILLIAILIGWDRSLQNPLAKAERVILVTVSLMPIITRVFNALNMPYTALILLVFFEGLFWRLKCEKNVQKP